MHLKQNVRVLLYRITGRRVASVIHNLYRSIVRQFMSDFTDEETSFLHSVTALIGSGTAVLDVGAHAGAWSRQLSTLVGSDGFVAAFEPVPENYRVLLKRTKKHTNILTFNVALSNHRGRSAILVPVDTCQPSTAAIGCTADQLKNPERMKSIPITLKRFDDIADSVLKGRVLSFIKCDVEGHELAMIEGSIETIRKFRPIIMIEILREKWKNGIPSQSNVAQLLVNYGYIMSQVVAGKIIMDESEFNKKFENFLFFPSDSSLRDLNS